MVCYIFSDKSRRSRHSRSLDFRPGEATSTHSCDKVRKVPNELRRADMIWPNGLNMFYQKYTEAYGIPVIGTYVYFNLIGMRCSMNKHE